MRDWLATMRKEKGMTQLEVAKKIDVSESYYYYIENGDRQKKMDVALAAKLSVVFGIPVAQIIELENQKSE
ncbi:MAG: helix-turn-helix transcriptional regulator [Oscillospiraceae bacterium]|nr:helix-turn-helix transcriptional regulator [Oscillospiraceae bacterium]